MWAKMATAGLMAMWMLGCGTSAGANDEARARPPAQRPTPSCEEALRSASHHVSWLSGLDAMSHAVAECIAQQWPDELRRCVVDVRAEPDLAACVDASERGAKVAMTSLKPRGGPGELIAKMAGFKDQMCQCTDKACADKVTEGLSRWGSEMAKASHATPTFTEEDTRNMASVTEEMTRCMTRAMSAPNKQSAADVIARMNEFSDRMCKCADKDCADVVTEAMTQWGTEIAKQDSAMAQITEDDAKQMAAVTETMTRCMTRLMSAPAPRRPARSR